MPGTFDPGGSKGDLLLFIATGEPAEISSHEAWPARATGRIEAHGIDCQHCKMTQPGPITAIGRLLEQYSENTAAETRMTFILRILRQPRILLKS